MKIFDIVHGHYSIYLRRLAFAVFHSVTKPTQAGRIETPRLSTIINRLFIIDCLQPIYIFATSQDDYQYQPISETPSNTTTAINSVDNNSWSLPSFNFRPLTYLQYALSDIADIATRPH
jgi:hypothetical protein